MSDTNVQPLFWLRYLDDIFCIWTDDLEKLKEFVSYLDSCLPTIRFTMDYSDTTINFLDVSVTKNSTKLSTDLFTKDTDSHQYLHATSCHPYSCKKSIPYGQAIRIKRICSDPEQLKLRLEDLSNLLVDRGYKQEIVSQQIHQVDAIDRETAYKTSKAKQHRDTYFSTNLSSCTKKMSMRYSTKQLSYFEVTKIATCFTNTTKLLEIINH